MNLNDTAWRKKLTSRIQKLIKDEGYENPYNFWINEIGDQISRSTLHGVLKGADFRISTLYKLAKALNVSVKDLVDF